LKETILVMSEAIKGTRQAEQAGSTRSRAGIATEAETFTTVSLRH
jgi:hypothetical protein